MSLSIELNSKSEKPHIFSQGELVSGKVIFNCSKSEDVSAIIISLKGELHTRVVAGAIYSDRAYTCDTGLFEISQALFEGPYTIPAGRHEYEFQFTFPDHVLEPIKHKFEIDDLFTSHIDDKRLPPSCEMTDKGNYVYSNGIVVYALHAKMPRKVRDLKATQQILFYPYRLEDNLDPTPKTVSKSISNQLRVADDGVSLRELTSGEAFKEKLHSSSKTRTVTFNVCFTAPSVVVLGEEVPLKLAIHPDPSSNDLDNYKMQPSITLIDYSVSMEGRWVVRADFALFVSSSDQRGQCGKVVEVSKGTDSIPMTLDEEITLDTITLDPMTFAPTFKSFQMTGNWSLRVKARVMCAGKEFTVFIPSERVTLLSPKVHPDLLGSAPAYDEVVRPSEGKVPAYEPSSLATDTKNPFGPS